MNLAVDVHDTIAAIAAPPGIAARSVVRVSGPQALELVGSLFAADDPAISLHDVRLSTRVTGALRTECEVPCALWVWPSARSYTRQPTVEIHLLGGAALVDAVLKAVCARGARPAEPGEFTLRAFLAGRIDLTQAEAVLGVIDACGPGELDAALVQLAGGLSQPLAALREQLVRVLAELEAGLDFADEDLEFIAPDVLCRTLAGAELEVAGIVAQLATRAVGGELPRVVLAGPPNAGKSSLFNALAARWGTAGESAALVSAQPGTTRDYLSAPLNLAGFACELIDTAGIDAAAQADSIAGVAQAMTSSQQRQADLLLHCASAEQPAAPTTSAGLRVLTKSDLGPDAVYPPWLACSSLTGEGLEDLAAAIRAALADAKAGQAVAATAVRCGASLRLAQESLDRASKLAASHAGDELVAAEVRHALQELGRVVGVVSTDDLLDHIFSQFCIGK